MLQTTCDVVEQSLGDPDDPDDPAIESEGLGIYLIVNIYFIFQIFLTYIIPNFCSS